MTSKDNSVNIKSYHHGDLRSALVDEGLKLLGESDAEHLSLREVARNVGVSATAVYRHFPDKQALLSALSFEGGKHLAERQRVVQDAAGGGLAGFDAIGREYVRFAVENPALFRLMMTKARYGAMLEVRNEGDGGLGLLRQNVDALAADDISEDQKRTRAVQAWAIVHGLAMLILDGQIPADDALIDATITSAFMHEAKA